MYRAISVIFIVSILVGICSATQLQFEQVPLPDGRIVGGTPASIQNYPHQISMRYFGRHRCGGSIYSKNIIVSASHCVVNVDVNYMTIVAGSTLLSEPYVELAVSRILMHPKYKTSNQDYDVAILVLRGHLPFRSTIQPIALAKERPDEGTLVTVTGWGVLNQGDALVPDHLQSVDVNIVSNQDCRKAYTILFLTNRMLCAAVTGGGKDACQGDSGGPLIVGNQLLGIVSWGAGCAQANYPGVYSSVPDLYEWIEESAAANTIEFA